MKEQVLTVEEAYRAMFYFLEGEYELTKSDELGGSLVHCHGTFGRMEDPLILLRGRTGKPLCERRCRPMIRFLGNPRIQKFSKRVVRRDDS